MEDTSVFFSPYAGIWPHAFPEALVAAELTRAGSRLIYITCDGILADGCYVMSAHRLTCHSPLSARESICMDCRQKRDLLVKNLSVEEIRIETLVDNDALRKIRDTVDSVTPQSAYSFQYEELPVGRYALHEVILHYKLTELSEITDAAFDEFRCCLSHILITLKLTSKILNQFSLNRFLLYNTHVSNNYALMSFVKKQGIPVFGFHAGGNISRRLSTLWVFKYDMVSLYRHFIRLFDEFIAKIPATAETIAESTSHFTGLALGRSIFVYSRPKQQKGLDIRKYFGIGREKKILLATLSSYDELYSSQIMGVMDAGLEIFNDQVDWLQELISWIKGKPDLILLIRVHPREFPNQRDPVHSNHARRLASIFTDLPSNVKINWPTDNISLYDLATEVAVGLNAWSSVGKELGQLGIPVVLFCEKILWYPASLNFLAKNKREYFEKIENALNSGWSYAIMRQVFRWLAVEYSLSTISIRDAYDPENSVQPQGRKNMKAQIKKIVPGFVKRFLKGLFAVAEKERSKQRLAATSVLPDVSSLTKPLTNGGLFVRSLIEDKPVLELKLENYLSLSIEGEKAEIQKGIRKILKEIYHDRIGCSKLLLKLMKFAETGNEMSAPL
ncbi:MAG: hypothetical protein U1F16_04850 [Turneriella sp.]